MGLSLEQWEYLKELNDYVWMTYSYYGIPIQIVMIIYKILYPVYWQGVKRMEQFPSLLQDKLIRPFIFYGPIYYLFDIIVKVGSGKAFESACSMSFFSHHVITLLFLPFAVYSKHVPWFIISTGLFHAILLCFKRSYLQYIYLVAVLLYHYGILQPPFDNMIQYKLLNIGTILLYLTIIALWLNGCSH
ncbi:unnamed protein product [Paramecium octaurelia]|uniref:Transmembrane protein n=1 Tax=Paramecium octaurelia TaxID=43137 RepID=A0A8S1TC34_PAROT|nr:unnamed protein product [Paramecium octaurelia]